MMNNLLAWIQKSKCRVAQVIRGASEDYAKYLKKG